MRPPSTAHTDRPWRIQELTRDFRLEDVWALIVYPPLLREIGRPWRAGAGAS